MALPQPIVDAKWREVVGAAHSSCQVRLSRLTKLIFQSLASNHARCIAVDASTSLSKQKHEGKIVGTSCTDLYFYFESRSKPNLARNDSFDTKRGFAKTCVQRWLPLLLPTVDRHICTPIKMHRQLCFLWEIRSYHTSIRKHTRISNYSREGQLRKQRATCRNALHLSQRDFWQQRHSTTIH